MRVLDFDPEFTWDAGEPFPVALIERAREHARQHYEFTFVGTAIARWHGAGDSHGIYFVVLVCASCGQEIGRGIVWCEPPSDDAYPWQAGHWARAG